MVRSNLQYRSSALKPHTKKLKDKLENIQKRAARYVTHNFYNTKSVSNMLHHLNWPALFHRRNICRLSMLYKITHIWLLQTKTCIQFHNNHHTQFFTFRPSVHVLITKNTAFFLTQKHCGTPFHTWWYQQPLCLLTVRVSID